MTLDKIILDDFLTYEHLSYDIPNRPLQVQGRNLTEEDQESNGSGKSGIFTGIEFCIAASNSRDVRDNELVMFGKEKARAQLYASCKVRKESIHIDWTIKVKGSNQLTLFKKKEDGEWEEVSFSNVNDGKKYILAWFAISKEDLFNYYIVNKVRFKSFFKSSQKEKVDLISRFSDSSIIEGLENIDNTQLDSKYSELENAVSKTEGKIEITEHRIISEQNRDFSVELKEEKEEIEEEIESIEGEIEEIKKTIKSTQEEKEDLISETKEEELQMSEKEVLKKEGEKRLETEQLGLIDIEKEVTLSKKLVDEFKSTNWEEKKSIFNKKKDSKKELIDTENVTLRKREAQELSILKFLKGIETKLSGLITCPACSHEFVLDGDIDKLKSEKQTGAALKRKILEGKLKAEQAIQSIKDTVTEIEKEISDINKEEEIENKNKNKLDTAVNEVNSKLNDFKKKLNTLEEEIESQRRGIKLNQDNIKDIELEDKELDLKITGYNTSIQGKKTEIENYKTQLQGLKKSNNKELIKELKLEVTSLGKEKQALKVELQELGDKIYMRNQWKNNFKQFRMFLANQSLEVIEFHCNRYLKGMGSDLRIALEGYKVLANGTIKDDITAKIIRNRERTFSSFSGGEQGRLLFASILANRHMINSTHPYGGLDFLSVDEVFEGVDSIGIDSLIESAKDLNISVMIITHVLSQDVDQDILLVEKVNGISQIK